MKTHQVIEFFGSQVKAAAALGINQASISKWEELPPDNRQLQIERITLGALKAEPGCMDRVLGFKEKAIATHAAALQ
jgi:DNA-binding transcriptional regulator YdaS (Cro superfamily)